MKRTSLILTMLVLCGMQLRVEAISDAALRKITFQQKLNDNISLDLPFRDEEGRPVKLGDYFGRKPVILVPGYYGCPMLCTLVLNGLVETMQDLKWNIGDQFEVINFSIDPTEKPALAAEKKRTYLRRYGRPGAEKGWHFLIGDSRSIEKLCEEIGFQYAYDPTIKQYAHPSGFVVITPQGRIARYFFGVDFPAKELAPVLVAASTNQTGGPIRQLFLLCFHYSPITGKYGNLILTCVRIFGVATLVTLCVIIIRTIMRDRLNRLRKSD